jgi:hypothetical protein
MPGYLPWPSIYWKIDPPCHLDAVPSELARNLDGLLFLPGSRDGAFSLSAPSVAAPSPGTSPRNTGGLGHTPGESRNLLRTGYKSLEEAPAVLGGAKKLDPSA